MIGRLLGRFEVRTTERYTRLAADWVTGSAVRISESIGADFLSGYPGQPQIASRDVRERATDDAATERRRDGVVGKSVVHLSESLYASKRAGHCHGSGPFRP